MVNTGFKNEKDFVEALNNQKYEDLGENASMFIRQLYPSITHDSIIEAQNVGGRGLKPDVTISVTGDDTNVSLKKGTGNSVHQEKLALFLMYCSDFLNMTKVERDSFLTFIYGDGTLDGKGEVFNRLSDKLLYSTYKKEIGIIQSFLLRNSRQLIERFLVYGRKGLLLNIKADYLYHGKIEDGVWCPLDEAVDFLVEKAHNQPSQDFPALGPLTLQSWNRNLHGDPKFESRRDSIQIKWGGAMRRYISEINRIYLEKISRDPSLAKIKIFGDNRHGFKNAKDIAFGLNGCRVRNLRGPLLGLINKAFPGAALTDLIHSEMIRGAKPDVSITIGNITKNVSVFLGSGNSVHQEDFLEFLSFCRSSLNLRPEEERCLRLVYYGDGTTDGTAPVCDRIPNARTIKKKYPQETMIAQEFFDRNRRALAERFLVRGKYLDQPQSDFVFHGNSTEGVSVSYSLILDYIEAFNGKRFGLLSIGPLSFQMWNRNLGGDSAKEHKRKSLQIKWPSMPAKISEAIEQYKIEFNKSKIKGIDAEYELVSMLNRTRRDANALWGFLKSNIHIHGNNLFAIRVSKKVYSKRLEQKVFAKSDVFLCRANISDELLEEYGYYLDESIIKDNKIKIIPIDNSGISCKIPSSKSFTYAKISPSSFKKIFGGTIYGAGASVFVQPEEIHLNESVISGWDMDVSCFLGHFKDNGFISSDDISKVSVDEWQKIKDYSTSQIKEGIRMNKNIAMMIFTGFGLFENPYFAPFMFSHGEMGVNSIPKDFSVTTGSGRHKGVFSIVIKPVIRVSAPVSYFELGTEDFNIAAEP
ncbi:MAG: hypothetical protein UDD86_09140 [Sodaliphilus sp.]|nr:hypothetical protein [Sodaliphilus sp.]